MTDTCSICTEKYNKTRHTKVCCPYCDYSSCRECMETYLLGEPVARCMNPECRKEWTRLMLAGMMSKTFLANKYRDHTENLLYDTQRAMLPDTQPFVAFATYHDELGAVSADLQKQMNELKARLCLLKTQKDYVSVEQGRIYTNFMMPIYPEPGLVAECYEQLSSGARTAQTVMAGAYYNTRFGVSGKPAQLRFHRRCGDPECLGYLSTQWKCGLCNKWTCSDCHKLLGVDGRGRSRNIENVGGDAGVGAKRCWVVAAIDGESDDDEWSLDDNSDVETVCESVAEDKHVCNPDDVATAKLLNHDTRSCPKCDTPIYKIDGCDQMWCTQCHTAFSWKTGEIQTRIHNPHYYEWLRKRSATGEIPREPGDVVGDGGAGAGGVVEADELGVGRCGNVDLHERIRQLQTTVVTMTAHIRSTLLGVTGMSYPQYVKKVYAEYKKTHHFPIYVDIDVPMALVRALMHLREVVVFDGMMSTLRTYQRDFRLLRVSYLRGTIKEERFKQQLHLRNKKYMRDTELCQILEMFMHSAVDIYERANRVFTHNRLEFVRVSDEAKKPMCEKVLTDGIHVLFELNALLEYTNTSLDAVYTAFSTVKYNLNSQFDWVRV